MLYRYQLL